jgi:hypothetical protein
MQQNTMGTTTIFIILMKISPRGLRISELILRVCIEVPTDEHAKQQPGNYLPNQRDTFHV